MIDLQTWLRVSLINGGKPTGLKTAKDKCVKGQDTSPKDHRVYNMSEYLLTAAKWIIYKWCEKSIQANSIKKIHATD